MTWLRRVLTQDVAVLFSKDPLALIFKFAPFNALSFRNFAATSTAAIHLNFAEEARLAFQNLPQHLVASMQGALATQNLAFERERRNYQVQMDVMHSKMGQMQSLLELVAGSKRTKMSHGPSLTNLAVPRFAHAEPAPLPPLLLKSTTLKHTLSPTHTHDSLDYLGTLQNQSVFNFCAVPIAIATREIAIATRELFFRNPRVLGRMALRVGAVNVKPSTRLGVAASAHHCGDGGYAAAPVSGRHCQCGGVSRRSVHRRCLAAAACKLPIFSLLTHHSTLTHPPQLIILSTNPREVSLIFREYARAAGGHPNFIALSVSVLAVPCRRFYALDRAAPHSPLPSLPALPTPPPLLAALPSLPHPVYPRPLPTVFPSLICTRSTILARATLYTPLPRPRSLSLPALLGALRTCFPPPPAPASHPRLPLRTLLAQPYPRSLYPPAPLTSLPSLAAHHFPSLRPHRPTPSCPLPAPLISPRPRSVLPRPRHPLHSFYIQPHPCLLPLLPPALPSPCALLLPFPSRPRRPYLPSYRPRPLPAPLTVPSLPRRSSNRAVRTRLPLRHPHHAGSAVSQAIAPADARAKSSCARPRGGQKWDGRR
ncbi:hypothetical protein DFH09DRAFT_1475624 [Mycena vulgaris]|nr:hypothetical protein DFH09DRAFT_1475624 [Mycena vulgaris]